MYLCKKDQPATQIKRETLGLSEKNSDSILGTKLPVISLWLTDFQNSRLTFLWEYLTPAHEITLHKVFVTWICALTTYVSV